ncbi:MAG: molybdenum cofactor carrier [Gammaproteobacteria bacterium]|nr:molybdenum cofactor carrier [Gammaproteobacteria bacterium]
MIKRIVSGGQTGVDRGALDAALNMGFPCGGWCPRGRRAEDGPLSGKYPLKESVSSDYRQRTEWNVRDSDGTLILYEGTLEGGTALTRDLAESYGRPFLVIDLNDNQSVDRIRKWLEETQVHILNLAGPRESKNPGISGRAEACVMSLLTSNERLSV